MHYSLQPTAHSLQPRAEIEPRAQSLAGRRVRHPCRGGDDAQLPASQPWAGFYQAGRVPKVQGGYGTHVGGNGGAQGAEGQRGRRGRFCLAGPGKA